MRFFELELEWVIGWPVKPATEIQEPLPQAR